MSVKRLPLLGNPYTSAVQSGSFYSSGSGSATSTVTLGAAPTGTCLALHVAQSGTHFGWRYHASQTNYLWTPLPSFMVDSNSYPFCSLWIGQPATPGAVGGTSLTFTANGSVSFRSMGVVELSRVIKGEMLSDLTRFGWSNTGTVWGAGGIYPTTTLTIPSEKGLIVFGAAALNTGGAGMNMPSPSGLARSSSYVAGGHGGMVVGFPDPGAVLTPGPWFTSGFSATWSGSLVVLR